MKSTILANVPNLQAPIHQEGQVIHAGGIRNVTVSAKPIQIALFLAGLPLVVGISVFIACVSIGIAVLGAMMKSVEHVMSPTVPVAIPMQMIGKTVGSIARMFQMSISMSSRLASIVAMESGRMQVVAYDVRNADGTIRRIRVSGMIDRELAKVGDTISTWQVLELDAVVPIRRFENRSNGTNVRIYKPIIWWMSSLALGAIGCVAVIAILMLF